MVVTGGREEWLAAVAQAARMPLDPDAPEAGMVLEEEAAERLYHSLEDFFNAVTPPPVSEATATADVYIAWVEGLIGPDSEANPDEADEQEALADPGFRLISRIREGAPEEIIARDLKAMQCFKRVLHGLISTQALLEALEGERTGMSWEVFMADLKAAVNGMTISRSPGHDGHVLVTSVTDARGLPHRHVFIVGLSEGIFPAKVSEDPLYLDSERQALNARGIRLQTQAERADDDGLFYELLSLARESLTLSRPYVQEGVPWPESHLWRGILQVFEIKPAKIAIGAVVPAEDVVSRQEAALAAAYGLNPPETPEAVVRLHGWLLAAHGDYWGHIRRGRTIELDRMSRRRHNPYSGRLRDAALISEVADRLGPAHMWSASQFNEFGVCGFRFFAGRILKLDALEEPEDGMAATHLGTVYHEILEHTYQRLGELGFAIRAENAEEAVAVLYQAARPLLADAPARIGFRASAVWEQEKAVLLRQLEALIRLDFSPDSPTLKISRSDEERFPYRQEMSFENHVQLDLGGEVGRVRLNGRIDRIDRQGNQAIIIDYKSGGSTISTEQMERGRNFQMMVYLLAAEMLLAAQPKIGADSDGPQEVAGGMFWHLTTQKASGALRLDDAEGRAAIQQAREHLARYISQMRQGNFAAHANQLDEGRCVRYCDFHQLCRVQNIHQRKTQD
jgi:ATP-dependent helicase/nuclease subunit B